jgi:hypothetical protein
MTVGIEQFFRSMAGADWAAKNGGLSGAEFTAALELRAGADKAFDKGEFNRLGSSLGLSNEQSKALYELLESNGQVSTDALRDQLLKTAGADKAFTLAEFKGGVETLANKADDKKHDDVDFERDAGADGTLDRDEFKALARKAGITDEEQIDRAFDKLAGAGGELSRKEFEDGLGDTKLSNRQFADKVKELAGDDDKPVVNFWRDAGADKDLDADEFAQVAKQAGIEDEEQVQTVFNKVAGAGGEISREEWTAAFGDPKLSGEEFKARFNELV